MFAPIKDNLQFSFPFSSELLILFFLSLFFFQENLHLRGLRRRCRCPCRRSVQVEGNSFYLLAWARSGHPPFSPHSSSTIQPFTFDPLPRCSRLCKLCWQTIRVSNYRKTHTFIWFCFFYFFSSRVFFNRTTVIMCLGMCGEQESRELVKAIIGFNNII
jgi:hypothetical protein